MKNLFLSIIFLVFYANSSLAEPTQNITENQTYRIYPSYDEQLEQLYSMLGGLHSLSNICFNKNQQWRNFAQSLASSENLNPIRRTKLFAAFNTSYRVFTTTYQTCTDSARQAYALYKKQGKQLAINLLNKLAYTEK